ncbi:MAG: HRDC domain-containing protein [Muribaculaceae bacterium]|nr:HRDC domain-containing protein [Muribaculaceae bacterium]
MVLANPKICLQARYAPKEIKQQVIRADQLIAYIRKKDDESNGEMGITEMRTLAEFYLEQNKPDRSDYAQKYEKLAQNIVSQPPKADTSAEAAEGEALPTNNLESAEVDAGYGNKEDIRKQLKEYRLKQSRAEKIKPYYIFNDAQMEDLLDKMPRTKEGLLKVSGFGEVKTGKYGEDIIGILQGADN